MVWTVNDDAEMRRLIAWGVDGIISDYPDVLRRIAAAPAEVRSDAQLDQLGLQTAPDTRRRATAIGSLKRRGPALPGLR